MTLIPITDLSIPQMRIYHQLRDNAFTKDDSFIADSPKVVNLLLESSIEVRSILATADYYEEFEALIKSKDIPYLYVATKQLMETIVGHRLHHNCMMHGIRPTPTSLDALGDHIIMLDQTSSAENVGAIARSAAALGVNAYLVPNQGPHPYGRRALRVSMGHVGMLQLHLYDDIFTTLKTLKANGYTIFAAEVTPTSIPLAKVNVPHKWVLLMGHEGKGLSKEVVAACDHTVSIEMIEGVKSFNVAIAASIVMYAFKMRYNPDILK